MFEERDDRKLERDVEIATCRQLEMMQGECDWSSWKAYKGLGQFHYLHTYEAISGSETGHEGVIGHLMLTRTAPERLLTPFQVHSSRWSQFDGCMVAFWC
eukprot:3142964-Rhodomonas_salina.3